MAKTTDNPAAEEPTTVQDTPAAEVPPVVQEVDGLREKIDAAIETWMRVNIYNSSVSQSVQAINHIKASLGALRDEILQATK